MKLTLNVAQRVVLLGVLPNEALFHDMIQIDDLKNRIAISAKYSSKIGLKPHLVNGEVKAFTWDQTKEEKPVSFDLTPEQKNILIDIFDEIKKRKALVSSVHLSIYFQLIKE